MEGEVEMSGAVDLSECPNKVGRCKCGKCAVCGYQKHNALHGPFLGEPPESKPYDHEFVPVENQIRILICEVCFTSSFDPCPPETPGAVPDNLGGYIVCGYCRLEAKNSELSKALKDCREHLDYASEGRDG